VAGDGKGWPDLTLVRGDRLIFAELKSTEGKLTDDQVEWLTMLGNVGTVAIWRPCDWLDGSIETVLR
jgi:hypothetical protein